VTLPDVSALNIDDQAAVQRALHAARELRTCQADA